MLMMNKEVNFKQNESKFVFASAAHILKFGGNAILIINRVLFVSFTVQMKYWLAWVFKVYF